MQQKNYDPVPPPADPVTGLDGCPKCGTEMEPIEVAVEGLPLEHLQLCPGCYLVMWSGPDGLQCRQGVPMKKGVDSARELN